MRKFDRACEACRERQPSRFRTLLNRYLCEDCWRVYLRTGRVPEYEEVAAW